MNKHNLVLVQFNKKYDLTVIATLKQLIITYISTYVYEKINQIFIMSASDSSEETHYTVLKCTNNATYDELKRNYQRLIKEHHPDKNTKTMNNNRDYCIKIDQAWKILRDEKLRKEYDASLLQHQISVNTLIYAELDKNDIEFKDNNSTNYPCRCGDNFVIEKDYLLEESCIVECSQCSNCIIIR